MSLTSIEFRCPRCEGTSWGTQTGQIGSCHTPGCGFLWSRRHDFRVFFRTATGIGFGSAAELDAELGRGRETVGATAPAPLPRFAEALAELLTHVMAYPPTPAVVEGWTSHEQRVALAWATREVLVEDDPAAVRLPRPEFIEDRAATA